MAVHQGLLVKQGKLVKRGKLVNRGKLVKRTDWSNGEAPALQLAHGAAGSYSVLLSDSKRAPFTCGVSTATRRGHFSERARKLDRRIGKGEKTWIENRKGRPCGVSAGTATLQRRRSAPAATVRMEAALPGGPVRVGESERGKRRRPERAGGRRAQRTTQTDVALPGVGALADLGEPAPPKGPAGANLTPPRPHPGPAGANLGVLACADSEAAAGSEVSTSPSIRLRRKKL